MDAEGRRPNTASENTSSRAEKKKKLDLALRPEEASWLEDALTEFRKVRVNDGKDPHSFAGTELVTFLVQRCAMKFASG